MTVQLHYGRYGGRYTEECETLDEALRFAAAQEELGEIFAYGIDTDGVETHDYDATREAVEAKHSEMFPFTARLSSGFR